MARQAVDLVWEDTANDELDEILVELLYRSKDETEKVHGGSRHGREGNIERNCKCYALRLHQDYIFLSSTYPNNFFNVGLD